MAEGVGFEPTRPCGLAVFKTAALDRTMRPFLEHILPVAEGYRYAPPLSHARCKHLRVASLRRTLASRQLKLPTARTQPLVNIEIVPVSVETISMAEREGFEPSRGLVAPLTI